MLLQITRVPCPPCHAFTVKPHKLGKGETAEDVATDKGPPPPHYALVLTPLFASVTALRARKPLLLQ